MQWSHLYFIGLNTNSGLLAIGLEEITLASRNLEQLATLAGRKFF